MLNQIPEDGTMAVWIPKELQTEGSLLLGKTTQISCNWRESGGRCQGVPLRDKVLCIYEVQRNIRSSFVATGPAYVEE